KHNVYKNLVDLNMRVNLSNKDIDKLVVSTFDFFRIIKPSNLEVISLTMKYVLKALDINQVVDIIEKSRDNVKEYKLEFGGAYIKNTYVRFDQKYKGKLLRLLYAFNKSFNGLYSKQNVLILISKFLYSYKKIILIE